jgi:integrase
MPAQLTKRTSRHTGRVSWQVRVRVGTKADGSARYLLRTFPLQREAKAFLEDTLKDLRGGRPVEPSKLTLNAYLDQWLEAAARPALRPNTFESYCNFLDRYIRPELGEIDLGKLTPLLLQGRVERLSKHRVNLRQKKVRKGEAVPPTPPARTLSPRTIRYAMTILAAALHRAVKWRMLPVNPCDSIELPRQARRQMNALSAEDARRFLEAAEGTRHEALFKLALVTGMRPSEYLGLQWQDVDLKKGAVSVQRALIVTGGRWQFAETKTGRSRRTIPVPASVVETLHRHKAAQAEQRLKVGPAWEDNKLVFPDDIGRPLDRRSVLMTHLRPLLHKAGLSDTLRLYDLRHSAATLMLAAGIHPKIAAERLGHASTTMTLDVYSHVTPTMQQAASDKLGELLFGIEGSK